MKRILTVLLTMMMVLSLYGCGEKKKEEKKEDTIVENNDVSLKESDEENTDFSNANVGDVLDQPEKLLEAKQFYVYFTYPDDSNETGIATAELVLDDADDEQPDIVYISDGTLKTEESIYELDADGNLTIYNKDVFMESFVKDETLTETELAAEKEEIIQILFRFGYSFVKANPEYKYEKCEDEKLVLTGDAFVYNVLNNGQVVRKIWVDKATGIFVKIELPDGTEEVVVQEINMNELGIPEYK